MPASSAEPAGLTGRPPFPDPAGPAAGSGDDSGWVSRQVEAMAAAWARGECVSAEELLARHPELGDDAAIRLIYEEVCLRRESGQDVATAEVVNRFPRWREKLQVVLGCDRLLRPFCRFAVLPEVGEDLGPFRLKAELGRGASGRTYLAVEPGLADRLVVLKIMPDDQDEHLSLARLQHTHIIPLYSEQTFRERGLRALCMPYLGGTSLARILEGMSEVPPAQRRGRHVLEVIDKAQAMRFVPSIGDGPYRRYLEQASYVQAVCWIAACLADALQSAHAHGLVHMDVKPSNVLIAGDGLPMLLDFHLARRPIQAGERIDDRLGGTPGWMAPEHRAALEAVSVGEGVPDVVNGRADVYALGLLLCEALGGPGAAQDAAAGRAWRRRNSDVSAGLSDIVQKCLAVRPADRYDDDALADDLRRQINDLPLHGVPNRSLAERWRKWRRRRPEALTRGTALIITAAALIIVLVLVQTIYRQRVDEIETALEDGRKLRHAGRFAEAVHTLGRGVERARAVPAVQPLAGALDEELRLARRGQQSAALHGLAELIRFRYGIDLPASAEAEALLENIRVIWEERLLLLAPSAGALDAQTEQVIRTDLLDLAIAWAELRVRLAPPAEVDTARRASLRVLDEAGASCGPSPRLDRLRRSIAGVKGLDDSRRALLPLTMSTLDHYDLGRSYLRANRFRTAAGEFQRVLEERPQDFWSNFYQGLCAYRLGQFHDALAAFRTCVALAPASAECYYNRARVAEALRRDDEADRDYSRALELDSRLTPAWLNRGLLAYKSNRHDDAIALFRRALGTASNAQMSGAIHYNLALTYLARGDRSAALASSQEALARGHDEARGLRDRLQRKP